MEHIKGEGDVLNKFCILDKRNIKINNNNNGSAQVVLEVDHISAVHWCGRCAE